MIDYIYLWYIYHALVFLHLVTSKQNYAMSTRERKFCTAASRLRPLHNLLDLPK